MALQISALPMLMFILAFFLIDRMSPGPTLTEREAIPFDQPVGGIADLEPDGILSFIVLLALGLTIAWIAVAWHRYILLGERSGLPLPMVNLPEIGLYLITLVKMLVLFTLLAIPVLALMLIFPALSWSFTGGTPVLVSVGLTFVFLRVGTALCAAAMGNGLRLVDAWMSTGPHWKSIAVLSVLTVALDTGIGLFLTLLGDHFFSEALGLAAGWISLFFYLCVLTTLYGHFTENRELG